MKSPENQGWLPFKLDGELQPGEGLQGKKEIPDGYVSEVLPRTDETLVPTVDYEHAYEVLDRLMLAYDQNEPPYSRESTRLPHHPSHMPETLERGGVEHAVFMFSACYYMRGGIKSNDAVKRLSKVYAQRPELFNCEIAKDVEEAEIEDILRMNGLGFQKDIAKQWVENAGRLHEKYDGDPRNIFEGVETYEQSQKLIQNDSKGGGFVGFKEKMTSMIIYFLMDEKLINGFNFPIPIDFHVLRVSIANEMITFGDVPYGTDLFTDDTKRELRKLYFTYAEERGVDPLRLCNAVWMLSESSCGRTPGNITLEPHGRKNREGRTAYLVPNQVDTTSPAQQKAYQESCGSCPIQETCEFNIPSKPYYVNGGLVVRGHRVRFPLPMPRPMDTHPTLY